MTAVSHILWCGGFAFEEYESGIKNFAEYFSFFRGCANMDTL